MSAREITDHRRSVPSGLLCQTMLVTLLILGSWFAHQEAMYALWRVIEWCFGDAAFFFCYQPVQYLTWALLPAVASACVGLYFRRLPGILGIGIGSLLFAAKCCYLFKMSTERKGIYTSVDESGQIWDILVTHVVLTDFCAVIALLVSHRYRRFRCVGG